MKDGRIVSVLVARSVKVWQNTVRWRIDPAPNEIRNVTLIGRLDESNCSFLDFHVLPSMDRARRFDLRLRDAWLNHGQRLSDLVEFRNVVTKLPRL